MEEIHKLRKELSQKEVEFFQLLVRVAHTAENLIETAGRNPSHIAYNKAVEAYEKMIEAKLWLGQALESIGEITEDTFVPSVEEEKRDIPSAS